MEFVSDNFDVTRRDDREILFSLVVPCYKVSEYLPTFFETLESQTADMSRGEVVFVIDGCPEDSETIVKDWARGVAFPVKVVTQENRGLSEARNTGVRHSQGHWVSFPDPDDELEPTYMERVLEVAVEYTDMPMLVTRLSLIGPDGKPKGHPLDFKFHPVEGSRVVDLEVTPEMIHLQSASAFFRRELFDELDVWFSPKLRTNFEDAHFIARLLQLLERPRYAIVPEAVYLYKQRADGSSMVAQSKENYDRYVALSRDAYLPILEPYSEEDNAPQWLGNLFLYDIWWLFQASLKMHSTVFGLSDEVKTELNELLRLVLGKIGGDTIRKFRVVYIPEQVRAAWEVAATHSLQESPVLVREYDRQLKLQRVVYFSTEPVAGISLLHEDEGVEILNEKSMAVEFLGTVWVRENIVWISGLNEGTVGAVEDELRLASPSQPLAFGGQPLHERIIRELNETFVRPKPPRAHSLKPRRKSWRAKMRRARKRIAFVLPFRLGQLTGYSRRFVGAWVVMDRDNQANDNGEAFYRYLKDHRPDINSWFVINKQSPDYLRLKRDGFKVVPFRSKRHFLLMKQATVLASSQADAYVLESFPRNVMTKTWNYAFLQHGVVHNSLHRWLNPKDIQVLVASTQPEFDEFVRDDGLYKFTDKEVRLTGQPRHDRLTELASELPFEERRPTILVMPTWRNYLFDGRISGGNARRPIEEFYESEFVREWSGLLNSDLFRELGADPSVDIYVLPHPNMDEHWSSLELPAGVERITYASGRAQEYLARATLTLTDYSSQAFEGAYVGAPTVYFQFDREIFFSGDHIAAPGYFEHERDGFGPVCLSARECETGIRQMLDRTHPHYGEYMKRVEDLYPHRDGRASERVVAALESLDSIGHCTGTCQRASSLW